MVTAVITGASKRLGQEYVDAIIAQYPSVDAFWLVDRDKESLRAIAEAHPDKTIAAVSLDLSVSENLELFERLLRENAPEIKVLVNGADSGKLADFFSTGKADQISMVDLNCKALTAVTRMCLPYMLDDSLILNISSVASFVPMPRMSVYSATKAYVTAFSKALHNELAPRGIKVTAVCMGPTDTNFWDIAGVPESKSPLLDKLPKIDSRAMAVGSLRAAKRGKAMYTRNITYKFFHVASKILPHSLLMQFTEF